MAFASARLVQDGLVEMSASIPIRVTITAKGAAFLRRSVRA